MNTLTYKCCNASSKGGVGMKLFLSNFTLQGQSQVLVELLGIFGHSRTKVAIRPKGSTTSGCTTSIATLSVLV